MTPQWVRSLHPDAEWHYRLLESVCRRDGMIDPQVAYVLATAHHRSQLGRWMDDVTGGWAYDHDARLGNVADGDGTRYRRRGYAQLVGRSAYRRFEVLLDIPLVARPGLASVPEVAADILVVGMRLGGFTGSVLSEWVTETSVDYVAAHRVLGEVDRAVRVAELARRFEVGLQGGDGLGLSRFEIRRVQADLRSIGWPVRVDGALGSFTRRAVRDFQAGYTFVDLGSDGYPDPITRLALANCAAGGGFASPHFRFAEFRTAGRGRLCATNRVIRVERALLGALESYRERVNEPVHLACGYRSFGQNLAVGARPDSEHLMGRAVHIDRPMVPVATAMSLGSFTSIGHCDGMAVHLGVRSDAEAVEPRVYSLPR